MESGYLLLRSSDGVSTFSSDIETLLESLLVHDCRVYQGDVLRVCWDLDKFAKLLMTAPLIPQSCRKSLANDGRFVMGKWRVFGNDKVLSISKSGSGQDINIYGLDCLFPDEEEPEDLDGIMLMLMLALSHLKTDFGIPASQVKRLSSPVAIAEDTLFGGLDLPSLADVPDVAVDAVNYALDCDNRLWNTNYQIGHWKAGECYYSDMASAFPAVAAGLLDWRGAEFVESSRMVDDADCGFLKGRVTINPDFAYLSPYISALSGGGWTNPEGSQSDTLELGMVKWLQESGIGSFKLKSGWFIKCDKAATTPLKWQFHNLYAARRLSGFADWFSKKSMNGLVGKLIEQYPQKNGDVKYGKWFNPIWHSIITSHVAVKVSQKLMVEKITKEELVAVKVDGFLTTRSVGTTDEVGMGEWRNGGSRAVFVLSPNQTYFDDGKTYKKLMDGITGHPQSVSYDGLDLMTLGAAQNRVYQKTPETGNQLLNNKYVSSPVTR